MLNLVELGSNYLPLIHIVPKMRFVFIFRRNYRVSIEKMTSKAISRKIRGSRKPRISRIAKQRKTARDTGVRQGCMVVRPRQNKHSQRIRTHGQPCASARAAVRWCTAVPRPVPHGFAFFGLYIMFSFIFWRDLKPSFSSTLGRKLGFSISSINSTRGD